MNNQNVAIAYCIDNINVAESLDQQLSPAIGNLTHLYGSRNSQENPLTEQIIKHQGPVLLLISDNYLKSTACMLGGLHMLNEKQEEILPVVIDGLRKDKETGEPILISTQFDRISDMIQYINYWQDQYLDLRRQKRELSDLDEKTFNDHLKSIREISSETSEFLRVLRNMEHHSLQEFTHNDFQAFFQFASDQHTWESFQKNRLHFRMQQQAGSASGVMDTDVEVIDRQGGSHQDTAEVDLSAIPGMDLLEMDEQAEEQQEELENALTTEAPTLEDELNASLAQEEEEEEDEEPHLVVEAEESTDQSPSPELEIPLEIANEEEEKEEEEQEENNEEEEVSEEEEMALEVPVENILENAWALAEANNTSAALQHLEDAKLNYQAPELEYYQALILAQFDQNLVAAKQKLEQLTASVPAHQESLFLLGEVSEIMESFQDAGDAYEKLYQIQPDYKGLKYRLGMVWAHHFEDKAQSAADLLAEAVKDDPENADAIYQYGLLLNEKLDQQEKAITYLNKTLSLSADHPFAHYDLALIYHQQGNNTAAAAAYQQAIIINPELKTPENDMAFNNIATVVEDSNAIEQTTLEALKNNIAQLEDLINAREEENTKLKLSRPGTDKTVFISGATAGIGRATATLFAENGFRLILNGRRNERLEELKATFEEEYDVDVKLLPFDVSEVSAVQEAVAGLGEDWQNVDILINNAGKARGSAPIHEGDFAHWDEMIDTNIKGLLYLTRAISPQMVARKSGHIINVGSVVGKEVYKNGNVYCATKFAVEGLTKAMRMDLHEHNIRVSQISPAHVEETEFASVKHDGDQEKANIYEDFKPLTAQDVAETIYFMATRPAHVNVQDVLIMGTQQVTATMIDRSGRAPAENSQEG